MPVVEIEEFLEHTDIPFNEDELSIAHHGILGMKWGREQGPPYPLDSGDHSKSETSAAKAAGVKVGSDSGKGTIAKVVDKIKEKKAEKEKTKALAEEMKKKQEEDAKKDAIKAALASGDREQIKAVASDQSVTSNDLREALNKADQIDQLNASTSAWAKIDEAMDKASDISNWMTTGTNLWNNIAKVNNAFNKTGNDLPIIGQDNSKLKSSDDKKKEEKAKATKKANEAAIKSGDEKKIAERLDKMSDEEVRNARTRLQNVNDIKTGNYKNDKGKISEKGWSNLDEAVKSLNLGKPAEDYTAADWNKVNDYINKNF